MYWKMESAFPSPLESTVASALLLLSTTPPSLSPPPNSNPNECKISNSDSLALSNSKSCSSTMTSDDGLSAEIRAHQLKVFALVARFHEMKLKVVRKSRSKNIRSSDHRKITSGKTAMMISPGSASATTEASSCLSTSSSAISSARSCNVSQIGREGLAQDVKRKVSSSALLRRRAEAILKLLSRAGCASEVRIRQLLGDNPDTSKALRMLLKLEEVKRSGAGGRNDPFIYTIA